MIVRHAIATSALRLLAIATPALPPARDDGHASLAPQDVSLRGSVPKQSRGARGLFRAPGVCVRHAIAVSPLRLLGMTLLQEDR